MKSNKKRLKEITNSLNVRYTSIVKNEMFRVEPYFRKRIAENDPGFTFNVIPCSIN